jgi:molybdopterin molybdotransferase
LISFDDALAALLKICTPVERSEWLAVRDARGRVLEQPVTAGQPVPPFANSAMDGFAVRTADFIGPPPYVLPIAGRIAAGCNELPSLNTRHVCSIFTGAPMPEGADAVVPVEVADVHEGRAVFHAAPSIGQHVRAIGDDLEAGVCTLEAGQLMNARSVAVAVASGQGKLPVYLRPRVAVLLTGDELTPAGEPLAPGAIWDVNGPMLTVAIEESGGSLVALCHAKDDHQSITDKLAELTSDADMIVTSGGVSVGEEDHVIESFKAAGGQLAFAGVAMKPGKPVAAGKVGNAIWLGLPGNPVSAFVGWTLFGKAGLARLSGQVGPVLSKTLAVAANTARHKPGRCEFRPAKLAGFDAQGRRLISLQKATFSARTRSLVKADALALIPAEADEIRKGDLLEIIPLNQAGEGAPL